MKKQKGFTYIIIAVIIMIMTTMLFLISTNINYKENKAQIILSNYQNELKYITENNLDENSLNQLNVSFKEYIKSNNYNSKICNIYFDGDYYYLSNFQDLNYSIINDQETIVLEKAEVLENIHFGECSFNISSKNKLKYHFEIYKDKEKRIVSE